MVSNNQNYELLKLFFKEKSLVRQHVDSFNYFIDYEMKSILKANNIIDSDIDHTFYLKYLDIRVGIPSITENMVESNVFPQECRNRDLTYASNIYVDIEYTRNKQIIVKRDLCLGRIPIMLRSSRCMLNNILKSNGIIESKKAVSKRIAQSQECFIDNGGYFIVKGNERVIQIQEQLSKNRIILETGKNGIYASVTSSSIEHKSKTNIIFKNDVFYVQSTIFTEDVPAIIVAKALGIGSDKTISEIIGKELFHIVNLSFEEPISKSIFRDGQAIQYLSKYIRMRPEDPKIETTRAILSEKLLPNVKFDTDLRNKGIYVCLMIRRLSMAKDGILKSDDKDYLGNKRFELAGQLLSILFEDTFKKFNFELKRSIDKILSKRTRTSEFDALTFFNLQTSNVTSALNRAIASGNWNLKRFRMERAGVTNIMTRYSYICALGMMTKINSHFEKTRKVSGPRALHTSSWGMFCPADTPEGESCGLVKNLALLTEITTDSDVLPVENFLETHGVIKVECCSGEEFYQGRNFLVFINGSLFGISGRPEILTDSFRKVRRMGRIHQFVSIFMNEVEKSIFISTDNGRIARPLLILDQKKLTNLPSKMEVADNFEKRFFDEEMTDLMERLDLNFNSDKLKYKTFSDFIREGKIEYLDVNEENNCLIAFRPEDITENSTHLEISEFAILGNVAGLVPFPHHNQSPRNTYQCAMGKQAIGHIATNVKKRFDSIILQMNYTQRPMAASKTLEINNYIKLPSGLNAMVAVMSYSGYDIEDALILNQGSVDRGFARVEVYRTETFSLKKYPSGACETLYVGDSNSGIVNVGVKVQEGDILLSKVNPNDGSVFHMRHKGHPAYIEKVMLTRSEDETIIKIVTRETRVPEIGDKFSSRHGQKGVVGLIVPQADMPFSEQGLSPDIIMNPHGFPSRMTVGKIIEQVSGKAGILEGKFADATAFKKNCVAETCQTLVDHGFSYSGKDIFTSGTTGESFEAYIFYGPIFYQRLKHMVADKMHCRARGPRAVLTRQPTEGRSKDGGLRLGEMERDCLIGYGASGLLNERLMVSSDSFDAYVCKECGVICYMGCCTMCKKNNPVCVKMPYACKLLFQELMAMNIFPKIELE